MKISHEKLIAQAEATGIRPDVLEKVAHLLGLLEALQNLYLISINLRRENLRLCSHAGKSEICLTAMASCI